MARRSRSPPISAIAAPDVPRRRKPATARKPPPNAEMIRSFCVIFTACLQCEMTCMNSLPGLVLLVLQLLLQLDGQGFHRRLLAKFFYFFTGHLDAEPRRDLL